MPLLWTAVAAGVLLAGCDNFQFTADLATEAPSNPNITSVEVNLLGLDLRRDDGTDRTLEFSNPEVVNLLDLESGDPMRLFTDEELPAGHYVGVRLLFDSDEDPNQITTSTGDFPIVLADDAFASVDFTVKESSGTSSGGSKALSLMLDLRQSLSFDGVAEEYTLTTHLRAVPTNDAAEVQGNVLVDCTETGSLDTIGAVYLFAGHDVEPDDLDGSGLGRSQRRVWPARVPVDSSTRSGSCPRTTTRSRSRAAATARTWRSTTISISATCRTSRSTTRRACSATSTEGPLARLTSAGTGAGSCGSRAARRCGP